MATEDYLLTFVIALIFAFALIFCVKKLISGIKKWRLQRMLKRWENSPIKDKVIVHNTPRGKTLPSPSAFTLKLETYLRMAKIPYELDTKDVVGSKGKFPWITYNGTNVDDSQLCIEFLNKELSINLNKSFTPEQMALARACRIVLEEHFFWGIVQYRAIDNTKRMFDLVNLPGPKRLLAFLIKRYMSKRMYEVGMGRHSPADIYQMTEEDLRTVSTNLGDKMYFGGEEPCEDDAAAFGILAQIVWAMPGSSFEKLLDGELGNLKLYCERMKERYWPDWDSCLDRSS